MCLKTNQKRVKLTSEETECYKLLQIDRDKGYFFTPYQGEIISQEVLDGKKAFRAKGFIRKRKYDVSDNEIFEYDKGLIHAFLEEPNRYECTGFVVVKCHVPKNVCYAKNDVQIAAKEIVFDEIVFDVRRGEYNKKYYNLN